MMKRLIALFLLLLPLGAHAIEGCWVEPPAGVSFPEVSIENQQATAYGHLDVYCEAGMPYQVEISNAEQGGFVYLSAGGATSIPVHLVQSDSRLPWGKSSQGESMGGTGQGERTSHPFEAQILLEGLPEAGVYRGVLDINLEF